MLYFGPKTYYEIQPYNIWGLTLTEVEIDVLTSEYKVIMPLLLSEFDRD